MVEESAMHGGALERDGRVSEMRTLRVLLLGIVTWIWLCLFFINVYGESPRPFSQRGGGKQSRKRCLSL